MRYAIIADIHANLAAFTAVLDDIQRRGGVAELWCLGDIVGYGPDPHECIELLRRQKHVSVAGNHDWAAIGKIATDDFNHDAAAASHWTAGQLTPEDVSYLESLPETIAKGDFTLVHGSPREPVWEYITSTGVACENFDYFKSRYCLVGHTHAPAIFKAREDGSCAASQFVGDDGLKLGKSRLIVNPGGVGQPRDGYPEASYAIYDTEANLINLYRVPYDIASTQAKMMQAGLPLRLASRLSLGV